MDTKFRKIHNGHTEFINYTQFHEPKSNIAPYEVVKTVHIPNSERYICAVRTVCYMK
jgi:hypothetical protein